MTALTVETSPQANEESTPMGDTPAGTKTTRPANNASTPKQVTSAGSHTTPEGHIGPDAHRPAAPGGQTTRPTNVPSTPIREPSAGSQFPPGGHDTNGAHASIAPGGVLSLISDAVEADPAFLSLVADVVDDLERVRIANENRLRHLTRSATDADGEVRGLGLDLRNPHVRRIASVVDQIGAAEHDAVLALQNLMRKHPLGPWVKATVGVGEKQAARLLAVIGDPYVRPELTRADGTVEPSRPRLVSELWAFCGLHVLPARQPVADAQGSNAGGNQTGHPDHVRPDTHRPYVGVAPKRQRGQRANWSTVAKTRAYLIAESCIKQRQSPFRAVYDDARAKYADAVHGVECVRCGPKGKPAPPGSPLSDGHKHARAMRAVSKELLRELWRESKRLHEQSNPI